jgi:hypothetical protein
MMSHGLMALLRQDIERDPFELSSELHSTLMDMQREVVCTRSLTGCEPSVAAVHAVQMAAVVCRAVNRDPHAAIAYTFDPYAAFFIATALEHRHGLAGQTGPKYDVA